MLHREARGHPRKVDPVIRQARAAWCEVSAAGVRQDSDDLDNERKETNMSNQLEQRTAQMKAHISAAVMFIALFGAGYMVSPSVESAVSPVTVAALTPSFDPDAQWSGEENLNSTTGYEDVRSEIAVAEEHIQAF
jgi:hypothetical protein